MVGARTKTRVWARSWQRWGLGVCLGVVCVVGEVGAQDTLASRTGADLPIHEVARAGTREALQALLQAHPEQRDARNSLGATPLHQAALNLDSGPLEVLISAGAPPNSRDLEGRTPLHMAAFATRTANALRLLQAGADPLLKTDGGRDVLSLARRVRADELAGEVSLWLLKGCQPGRPC